MFTFIPLTPPRTRSTTVRPLQHKTHPAPTAPARKPNPSCPAKRVRMATNDRSTEFSLGASDDSSTPTPGTPPADEAHVDWHSWRQTGRAMTIPALPFPPIQVFLPGEAKRLHLFEARYLALFEHVVVHYEKRCAHVLIDSSRQAMAAFGTVLHVRSWRRLDVGVSVEFEGVGRLRTAKMKAAAPFLRGDFEAVDDDRLEGAPRIAEASVLENKFWLAFRDVVSLCVKLGEDPVREKIDAATPTIDAVKGEEAADADKVDTLGGENSLFLLSPDAKRELFEQKLKQAARRAVDFEQLEFGEDVNDEMLARRARALSFAGWDFFPSHPNMRQKAIEQRDTLVRLRDVVTGLEQHGLKLAAKLAVQNAFSE